MRKGLDPVKAQAMLLCGQSSCGAEFHFPQEQANNVPRERERVTFRAGATSAGTETYS